MNKTNVYIHTLGCFKNEVDSSGISTILQRAGFNISNLEEADIIILNTCGFIRPAKEEAINSILRFIEYKKAKDIRLIVTGCLAQRYLLNLADEFPEVDAFVGLGKINAFPEIINRVLNGERVIENGDLKSLLNFEIEKFPLVYYLKVSDGCNNRCNYCAIPIIRGPLQTRSPDEILKEAQTAISNGSKEIILVAQDLTAYNYNDYRLVDLLRDLNSLGGNFWIRLLYLHPSRVDKILVETISSLSKVLKYVDIPIQHIDDEVLKSMGRPGREITERAIRLIKQIPDVIIRTSFIIGYPTETPVAFENLLRFLEEEKLHRAGFFIYSQEEGTPAYDLGDPIPDRVKRFRLRKAQALQEEIMLNFHKTLIGKRFRALIESVYKKSDDGETIFIGRTYMDAPEIDSRVFIKSSEDIYGRFADIEIEGISGYDFYGKVRRE